MPPLLVACPFHMHEPVGAAVAPLADERSTTRSEMAGVVTTDGEVAVGTGRSMTRVQAVAASAALTSAMVAFMSVLLKQVALAPTGSTASPGPGAGMPLAAFGAVTRKGDTMDRKQTDKNQVEGEGSYTGSKDYNERTQKFVDSGKVDEAARNARPQSEEERQAMQKAERVGKERAKDEDPALRDPKKVPHEGHQHRK
jgi:hypothetical protein